MSVLSGLCDAILSRMRRWLPMSILMLLGFYLMQLVALVVRFGALPNYIRYYDWPGNIRVIIESTPSAKDAFPIARDEWLLEIGYMNYDFGLGISEWGLFFAPAKAVGVYLVCVLLAINLTLLSRPGLARRQKLVFRAVNSGAAVMAALASLTLSWVVCCSTPTWVVGLGMLGLGVSTALALEPFGIWLQSVGVALLGAMVFIGLLAVTRANNKPVAKLNKALRRTDDHEFCRTSI